MRRVALVVGLGPLFAASSALGQAPTEAPSPASPQTSRPVSTDAPRAEDFPPPSRALAFRVAAAGVYRHLFDLSILGGGMEFSLGSAGERHDGYGNLRAIMGRTLAGLHVTEAAMTGTYEVHFGGFRFGPGGGINLLNIVRATDRGNTTSAGFVTLFRVGYDFGQRPGAFILGQYALDLYWGDLEKGAPTFSGEAMLSAGARF